MITLRSKSTSGRFIAAITIRNIDDALKSWLRVRAAQHGHSMEEEARRTLAQAMRENDAEFPVVPLGTRLHKHLAGLCEIAMPARRPVRAAPDFVARKTKRK